MIVFPIKVKNRIKNHISPSTVIIQNNLKTNWLSLKIKNRIKNLICPSDHTEPFTDELVLSQGQEQNEEPDLLK